MTLVKALGVTAILYLCFLSSVGAQSRPLIFIDADEGQFQTYLSAAMVKKGVPADVTINADAATLVLKASSVAIEKQSTGSKIARCLFAYCAGMEDRGHVAVQLLDGDRIVWSYSVNKGRGQKNMQSLAEAVAKHMKKDYFRR